MSEESLIAGAFKLSIDSPSRGIRLIESLANWRSRKLHMPYGDQAIFLRKELFHKIGGFPEIPIMEDYELIRRIRRMGKIAIIPEAVITSARRWEKLGILKTTFINQMIIVAYRLGVSPIKLHRWYYG